MTTNEVLRLSGTQWLRQGLVAKRNGLDSNRKPWLKGAQWTTRVQSRSAVAQTETDSCGSKAHSRRSRFSREAQWLGPSPEAVAQRRTVGELAERELTHEKV